ncbi:MAG TPA: hypothetical protein VGZ73_00330 [Bryobacteraceae bacterium]|nr:hypothetical protein [Bryobacteraceae bacterium]
MLHYRNVGPAFPDLDGVAVSLDRAAGRKNRYGAGLFCLLHGNPVCVPPDPGRSLDCRHDDADHVPRDPIVAPPHGQPLLLNPAQRHRRSRVAGDDSKCTTLREQAFESRASQVQHVNGRTHSIGRVSIIAKVDEIGPGQRLDKRTMHRQPTEATIENPDHPKSLSITSSCEQFFRPDSSIDGGGRGAHTGERFPP